MRFGDLTQSQLFNFMKIIKIFYFTHKTFKTFLGRTAKYGIRTNDTIDVQVQKNINFAKYLIA